MQSLVALKPKEQLSGFFVVVLFSGDTTNTNMYLSGLQQPKRNLPEDLTELQHNGK